MGLCRCLLVDTLVIVKRVCVCVCVCVRARARMLMHLYALMRKRRKFIEGDHVSMPICAREVFVVAKPGCAEPVYTLSAIFALSP